MRSPELFPSLLGAASSIAFAAFSGTALFNLFAWVNGGNELSLLDAASAASNSPVYAMLSIIFMVLAGVLGGMAAAKLSGHGPYVNALTSAMFVLMWSLVLIASPVSAATAEVITIIEGFVLPIPCALFGAYAFARLADVG
jgi:hypothetical protein